MDTQQTDTLRQAEQAELMGDLGRVMAELGWFFPRDRFSVGDWSSRSLPGDGKLYRRVFMTEDHILAEVYVYSGGSATAPACVLRTLSSSPDFWWHHLQTTLQKRGATAEMLPGTIMPCQMEAILCAALAAQDACREMARRAEQLAERADGLERQELAVLLEDLASVEYAYRTGQHVRF